MSYMTRRQKEKKKAKQQSINVFVQKSPDKNIACEEVEPEIAESTSAENNMASGSTMAVSSNAEKSSPPSDLTVTPTVSNTDEVTNNQFKMLIVNLDKTMSQGM